MKCKVCGAPSGKYPLCRACNIKKEQGKIIKCEQCHNWHYINIPCPVVSPTANQPLFLYDVKQTLLTKSEKDFYYGIIAAVPQGYSVFPQINLAAFINRKDDARFHNELFRNVDFLITDATFKPILVIEVNDQSHLTPDRKERDEKVQKICEEAGIPILKLWTSYGVNVEYIRSRIIEIVTAPPAERKHHFSKVPTPPTAPPIAPPLDKPQKHGCYIASAVYGSYDCPEVWTLRRYRDNSLAKTWIGRLFVRSYYAVSPTIVQWLGRTKWINQLWRNALDCLVAKLQKRGVESTPYQDTNW